MKLSDIRFKLYRVWGKTLGSKTLLRFELNERSGHEDYFGILIAECAFGKRVFVLGINYGRKPKSISRRFIFNSDTMDDEQDLSWSPPKIGDLVECMDHEDTVCLSEGRRYRVVGEKWKPAQNGQREMWRYLRVDTGRGIYDYEDNRFKTVKEDGQAKN